jgi:hypothetical protein
MSEIDDVETVTSGLKLGSDTVVATVFLTDIEPIWRPGVTITLMPAIIV